MANGSPKASTRSLPPERAFVVQLEANTSLVGEEIGGRVEHVVSGRAIRFHSASQLLEFLRSGAPTLSLENEEHQRRKRRNP